LFKGHVAPVSLPCYFYAILSTCCLGSERVYQLPVFTREFSHQLLEEIKHFEADNSLPKGRPNTMNNYGVSMPYIQIFILVYNMYSNTVNVNIMLTSLNTISQN